MEFCSVERSRIVLDLVQLQMNIRQARVFLLQHASVVNGVQLPGYFNFVTSVMSAVYQLGLDGAVSVVQGYVDEYSSQGLDRYALISLAGFQNVFGLV